MANAIIVVVIITAAAVATTPYNNTENVFIFNFKSHDDMRMELDCQNLDSEFGLFGYKEEQKTTPDRPGCLVCCVANTCK